MLIYLNRTGFNGLFGDGLATEQACMVHVRRKFVDVFERNGSTIARETIERIAGLYAVEKEARYKSPDERVALRQTRARPIFDELEEWLKSHLPKISGKTKQLFFVQSLIFVVKQTHSFHLRCSTT